MHQPETQTVSKVKKVVTYVVQLRGTKLLPRRRMEIRADDMRRNSFGDLILIRKKKIVGSWNREQLIGAWEKSVIKAEGKTKTKPKEIYEPPAPN
jgi:hypothetical protein